MKNINIGVANLVVYNQLRESMFDDSLLMETKNTASKFFDVVKNSPLLLAEFKVFSNIENQYITNDALALKYIEDGIKMFETYTLEDVAVEHEKLVPFINESVFDDERVALYESISTLIAESLSISENVDINKMHDAFSVVMSHLNKPKEKENSDTGYINEEVIEIAINKFNEKYDGMNEEDVKLFKQLVNAGDSEKETLFEEFKEENVTALTKLNEDNVSDKISKSLEKISEMTFNAETADGDIVKLYELRKGLL